MEWTRSISKAIQYIEDNICEELTTKEIARQSAISPFYFQKGFAMLCGFTVSEYIKNRRLTLAAAELVSTGRKIIDIALDYGYDSPDSFTKAFTRFHGATPSAVRRGEAMIKSFAALKLRLTLEGGYTMDYKIMKKDEFTIVGASKRFKYENAGTAIPEFWAEYFTTGKNEYVCSTYGVSIDNSMNGDEFEYLIADNYDPAQELPEGFVTKVIPKHTWGVFPCKGAMPDAMQDVQGRIFSEWLPGCKDYEIAAGYNIELNGDPGKYAKGTLDENYYCEVWIPVRQK